ncbi:hypothetical protein [Streptomyces virginiae]|uniref:hypothetical protein n=1 Tax=Streptomyces virginiae TaxID=1961 RepID=UPI003415D327
MAAYLADCEKRNVLPVQYSVQVQAVRDEGRLRPCFRKRRPETTAPAPTKWSAWCWRAWHSAPWTAC